VIDKLQIACDLERIFGMKRESWNEFLTALACIYLIAFSLPAIINPMSQNMEHWINWIQWFVWGVFALDLLIGILAAPSKKQYLKTHPLEIMCVALPALRPLRLLRLISIGSLVIHKVAVGRQFAIAVKVFLFSILLSYIAAVQITISERSVEKSNIKTFSDGLWWAITTVTTVGYGDKYPTTIEGRVLAVVLMLTGISLMGVVTASVAAWFVSMSQQEAKSKTD